MDKKNLVGYRFHPTGEELINHYLKNKILGKSWLVDDAISEINICNYEPIFLPSLSKLESKDPEWYFFSLREYASAKKTAAKRTTRTGYWKVTGADRKIKDKGGVIGIKKTIVFYEGRVPNGVRTPWVMHEYHITCLPPHQRNYVICKVMYKGEDMDILSGGNSNLSVPQPSHSSVSDLNSVRAVNTAPEVEQPAEDGLYMDDLLKPINEQEDLSPSGGFNTDTFFSDYNDNFNVQPQTPCDNEYWNRLLGYNDGNFEDVFSCTELIMQENRNNHMAKKPVTGIIPDYSSDSDDAESISATSYHGTSSSDDSPNSHFPSCSNTDSFKDLQSSEDPHRKILESQLTRRTIASKQEVKEGKSRVVSASKESSIAKTEKKGLFITEEAIQRKGNNPRYIYLMNMIIGFILLVPLLATAYRFY
ncbi:hypothetical protein AALP_AA6G015600 [Arabis alpina]|uniref:NAC domain-containing protein n=1 Tax=Arabis alpina TaxID=50452 RepID=A0A087GLE4_ARAAL|nr:hypothetical protein AALP_AA6G015600 [Arabis alpina]